MMISIFGYMGACVATRSGIGLEFVLALSLGIIAWIGCGRKSVLASLCIGFACGNTISLKMATELLYERVVMNARSASPLADISSTTTTINTFSGFFNVLLDNTQCLQYKDMQDKQGCLMFTYTIYMIVLYVVVWILIPWFFKFMINQLKEYFLGDDE